MRVEEVNVPLSEKPRQAASGVCQTEPPQVQRLDFYVARKVGLELPSHLWPAHEV